MLTNTQLTHTGTRCLADSRLDETLDDLDYPNEPREGDIREDSYDEDFVMSHRRMKQRATESFQRDIAELRQKRRDMQDKMFDMIDITAEIERAKSTLEGANSAFQRHAIKFNNTELPEPECVTLAEKIDRNRKIQAAAAAFDAQIDDSKNKLPRFKWSNMQETERDPTGLVQGIYNRRARINSLIADDVITDERLETMREETIEPTAPPPPKERTKKRRSFLKRKNSVTF